MNSLVVTAALLIGQCLSTAVPNSPVSVGALYFFNNNAAGNQVITSTIGLDGKITFANAFQTGGLGQHGNPTDIPDPLFSAGSIQASGNLLFVVNAGSNSISTFAIDPVHPTILTKIGKPVNSGGEFPISVTISPTTGNLCVLNAGAISGIKCFTVDSKKGLHPITNSWRSIPVNQTTPVTGFPNSFSQIKFTPDGSHLLVSHKGIPVPEDLNITQTPGFISSWEIVNPRTGELSRKEQRTWATNGLYPFEMVFIPGTKAFINPDILRGYVIYNFEDGFGSQMQSKMYPVNASIANCWAQYSPNTGTFFLSDNNTGVVSEVMVNTRTPLEGSKVLRQYNLGLSVLDEKIATIQGKDYLYVQQALATTLHVMALTSPGNASQIQTYNWVKETAGSGVLFDGFNLQGMEAYIKPQFK